MPVRLYFEHDGTAYRVHDCTYHEHKHKRLPLGDARATTRIFVPRTGTQRVYTFGKAESHAVTEAELAATAVERLRRAVEVRREFTYT